MNNLFRFKYRKVVAILFLITVLLTACTQPDPRPKGIFYEVTGGYNKMHILGSVHVGVEHMYPLEQNIEEIFNNSQTLVVEANIDNIDQEEISNVLYEYAFYKDGSNLSDYLDEQTLNEVKDILVPNFLTEEVLYQLKPWYIAQLITQLEQQKSKYDSEYGVDQYFLSKAGSKEIVELETVNDQFQPYSKMDMETNVKYLKLSLEDKDEIEEGLAELVDYWYNGKYDAIKTLRQELKNSIDTNSYKEYIEALLDQRDENIANKLDSMLKGDINKQYFVVIGYLHLASENSVIDHLEDLGYTVQKAN